MKKAPVNRIISFSNVDGPGNRTSVFFQGCTFHCRFCHNPETMSLCTHCGICVPGCPAGALRKDETGKVEWIQNRCVQCDQCIRSCPHFASPRVEWLSVDEVMERIRRSLPYIEGITVSGGDCTLYADFLTELFKKVREAGKTNLIDANGAYDFERDPELLSACDGVMLDVKAAGEAWHNWLIGHPSAMVKKNLRFLLEAHKLQEVRTVIFPGRDSENLETVQYVAKLIQDACDYKLIRYRPYGVRDIYQKELGELETPLEEVEKYAETACRLGASHTYVV